MILRCLPLNIFYWDAIKILESDLLEISFWRREEVTSTACLVGCGLKEIPLLCAQRLVRLRSLLMSTADVFG